MSLSVSSSYGAPLRAWMADALEAAEAVAQSTVEAFAAEAGSGSDSPCEDSGVAPARVTAADVGQLVQCRSRLLSKVEALRTSVKELRREVRDRHRKQQDFVTQMDSHMFDVERNEGDMRGRIEALVSEQGQLRCVVEQQDREQDALQTQFDEMVKQRQSCEGRVQFLMDHLVNLLSRGPTGEGNERMLVEILADGDDRAIVARRRLDLFLSQLEEARQENRSSAQRLSDMQCSTTAIHEHLCSLQNQIFNGMSSRGTTLDLRKRPHSWVPGEVMPASVVEDAADAGSSSCVPDVQARSRSQELPSASGARSSRGSGVTGDEGTSASKRTSLLNSTDLNGIHARTTAQQMRQRPHSWVSGQVVPASVPEEDGNPSSLIPAPDLEARSRSQEMRSTSAARSSQESDPSNNEHTSASRRAAPPNSSESSLTPVEIPHQAVEETHECEDGDSLVRRSRKTPRGVSPSSWAVVSTTQQNAGAERSRKDSFGSAPAVADASVLGSRSARQSDPSAERSRKTSSGSTLVGTDAPVPGTRTARQSDPVVSKTAHREGGDGVTVGTLPPEPLKRADLATLERKLHDALVAVAYENPVVRIGGGSQGMYRFGDTTKAYVNLSPTGEVVASHDGHTFEPICEFLDALSTSAHTLTPWGASTDSPTVGSAASGVGSAPVPSVSQVMPKSTASTPCASVPLPERQRMSAPSKLGSPQTRPASVACGGTRSGTTSPSSTHPPERHARLSNGAGSVSASVSARPKVADSGSAEVRRISPYRTGADRHPARQRREGDRSDGLAVCRSGALVGMEVRRRGPQSSHDVLNGTEKLEKPHTPSPSKGFGATTTVEPSAGSRTSSAPPPAVVSTQQPLPTVRMTTSLTRDPRLSPRTSGGSPLHTRGWSTSPPPGNSLRAPVAVAPSRGSSLTATAGCSPHTGSMNLPSSADQANASSVVPNPSRASPAGWQSQKVCSTVPLRTTSPPRGLGSASTMPFKGVGWVPQGPGPGPLLARPLLWLPQDGGQICGRD